MFHLTIPISCWKPRTLSVQFQGKHLSASFSYSVWYAQGFTQEVHSDCTERIPIWYMDLFFRKEYRQPDRQVQTAVAVGLWVGNVVLLCDYLNIRLIFLPLCQKNTSSWKEQITRTPATSMIFCLHGRENPEEVRALHLIYNAGRRLLGGFSYFLSDCGHVAMKLFRSEFPTCFQARFQCAAVLQHDFLIPAIFA